MPGLVLPLPGGPREYQVPAQRDWPDRAGPARSRIAFAAAHVVARADQSPAGTARLDWGATLRFRHRLWSLGLGGPTRWTPRSAAWAWTGRPPGN